MRFFALVIPYSLISLTYAQWEFSLPHPPELDLRSTILDRRDPEDLIPADQTSPLDSSWLLSETDLNPTDGSSTDWLLNSDTTKEPNASDLFLETSYLDDLESDLFAGGDLGCNSDTINDLQLFNKQRRGVSCSNPAMRESQPPKGSTQGGNSDENNEANGVSLAQLFNPLSLFPEDSGLCPPKIFGLSVIPLCAVFVPGTYVLIPGARYVTLLDVYPLTPGLMPTPCYDAPTTKLWCCKELVYTLSLEEFQRTLGMKTYQYDAHVCWLQSLIGFGDPLDETPHGF